MPYNSNIKSSYILLRSIYVGSAQSNPKLNPGKIRVLINNDPSFTAEGTLNLQGGLSGMAKLYKRLDLKDGDTIQFEVIGENEISIISPAVGLPDTVNDPCIPVFDAKKFRHIHIEEFRPENLNNWEPATETDVYLAFGVLQEFTDFRYCCGASIALLRKLNPSYCDATKPDAILIDRRTDQYLMAEWKMHSSDFSNNHHREDIDVLVCWHDNESNRSVLPHYVVSLRSVAQTAAKSVLSDI